MKEIGVVEKFGNIKIKQIIKILMDV